MAFVACFGHINGITLDLLFILLTIMTLRIVRRLNTAGTDLFLGTGKHYRLLLLILLDKYPVKGLHFLSGSHDPIFPMLII
jgi:hypothetical protein